MSLGTERLLGEKAEAELRAPQQPPKLTRLRITTVIPQDAVISGRSLDTAVRIIACANMGIGLSFLIGNIMMLFLLVSYPLHDFQLLDLTIHTDDPSHQIYHFANLSKKQIILLFTLTAMYFVMEVMIAKVLLLGAIRKSRSKCQHWLDIHKVLWIIHTTSLIYNLFDLNDPTAYTAAYISGGIVVFLGLSIHIVEKFTTRLSNGRDFASSVFQIRGV